MFHQKILTTTKLHTSFLPCFLPGDTHPDRTRVLIIITPPPVTRSPMQPRNLDVCPARGGVPPKSTPGRGVCASQNSPPRVEAWEDKFPSILNQIFPKKRPGGAELWYPSHRICLGLTSLLSCISSYPPNVLWLCVLSLIFNKLVSTWPRPLDPSLCIFLQ